jgi:UDP-GlcNAc:undecaprenyl-phosphate GlcNAc-1-phosphate transferase
VAVFLAVWFTVYGMVYQSWIHFGIQLQGLFLGSAIILVMGLIDDVTELTPFVKFVVQVGAALVLVLHDVVLSLFIGSNFFTQLLTVLWVVGITNSFNFLDNMDGLASGVAAICAFIFAINSYRQGDPQTLFLSLVLGGSLIAFLRFNFDPAVIFLGDAGSGFIGFYLAALSVAANYLETSQLQQLPIITPLLVFSVPLFDTFSVMTIRILEGRSIWDADNRHFSHRLVELGLSRRAAVLLIYLLTFTVGSLAILLGRVQLNDALLLLVHVVAIFTIIVILEYASLSGIRTNSGQQK